jgi:hypothetical protein
VRIISHYLLALGVLRLGGFPDIPMRARYFIALVRVEDPLYVLGTGHMHNPRAERMATLIPQNLREHHPSNWGEGLKELGIGAKVGQPADTDMSTHVEPSW